MHFIRHGQSEFNLGYNRTGRDPGTPDAALTPLGSEQARHAGAALSGRGITQLVASPYTRALQTATEIAGVLGVGIVVEPLAGERSLYSCDIGTPVAQLQASFPHADFSTVADGQWWPTLGETDAQLATRIAAFRAKWHALFHTGTYALVSHWYFLNALTDYDFENGEVLITKEF